MADSSTADLSKGKRITGGDRTSLADELRKRYDGGESIRSLASSTNRSYGFVHRLLSESGATLRSRGGANRNSKKDRKSTRLNSSHANISYAVFCLKKKKYEHQ